MNIPKEIIQKAIEGGWKRLSFFSLNEDVVIADLEEAYIVLDPTFWVALGSALGWAIIFKGKRVKNGSEVSVGAAAEWLIHAHHFYDLILQGKPTDDFWAELLGKK